MAPKLRRDDYTVGWVCALPVELAAAQEMLDEEHETPQLDAYDTNIYTCGRIGEHNVVIACLPEGQMGTNSAAAVAAQMRSAFGATRFGLMVGIGGGVPSKEADIRLGDVVVSKPLKVHGGVVQYDSGKATPSGFERTGSLNTPPTILLNAASNLRARYMRGRSKMSEYLSKLNKLPDFKRESAGLDVLFQADYDHTGGVTCEKCSMDRRETREDRKDVMVHYGTIASGNQVMRSAAERDSVSAELGGVLCFEMEAAGLMNNFPCLVIRGICDYADSHKNKKWQGYAAGTAAAYAKELLLVIPAAELARTLTVEEVTTEDHGPVRVRKSTYEIPFVKNRYFVGRRDELDELECKLLVDRECQEISIVGLGGAGKTQIALQFAYTVKEKWPEYSVFWLPALSLESFEQACASMARALQIPQAADKDEDVKELVREFLSDSERAGKWLLVLDNADDPDILFGTGDAKGIVDYLPESEDGIIVYTTRTREVAVSQTRGDLIELGPMNTSDATEFLEKSLKRKDLRTGAITTELLDALDYLPLAIAQAAAYLNINKMPVAKYLRLLRNTEQDIVSLMSREFRDNTRYRGADNAVASTWIVSFQQIQERDTAAAEILAFISNIEWKAIPRSLLPGAEPQERIEDAIGTLCGYSFLARRENDDPDDTDGDDDEDGEEWYDMHRLVHLATRIWISKNGNEKETMEETVRHFVKVFPTPDYGNQEVWRSYLPHALRLLENLHEFHAEKTAELCLLVGLCLRLDGRGPEAVKWLEESCRWRETFDETDPDRLWSEHELAIAYEADGQVKKAVALLEHVVEIQATTLEESHPNRLQSQHELGYTYWADGQIKEAVSLLEHVVKIQAITLEETHPNRLQSQHQLGVSYWADGQIKKAVELLEHVVRVQDTTLPETHPNRLQSQHALSVSYEADGQIKKAVELLEHVVKVREVTLVETHPDRLASQHQLAVSYWADGRVSEAVALLEHVTNVHKIMLAETHPSRLQSQHALSVTYEANGQVAEAVALLEHVVKVRKTSLSETHPDRLASQHQLGVSYWAVGRIKEARELLEYVVKVRQDILAPTHPDRRVSERSLANILGSFDWDNV